MEMAHQSKTEAMNETINALIEKEILSKKLQTPQQNPTPPSENFFEFYGKGGTILFLFSFWLKFSSLRCYMK